MNLGQFIRQQRLKKGYTMDQLAKLIGKNKAYISLTNLLYHTEILYST